MRRQRRIQVEGRAGQNDVRSRPCPVVSASSKAATSLSKGRTFVRSPATSVCRAPRRIILINCRDLRTIPVSVGTGINGTDTTGRHVDDAAKGSKVPFLTRRRADGRR